MIEIKLTNLLLILTEEEILKCLMRMPFTMEKAVKRGREKTQQQNRQDETYQRNIPVSI